MKRTTKWKMKTTRTIPIVRNGLLMALLCALAATGLVYGDEDRPALSQAEEDALFADPLDTFFDAFREKREHIESIRARFIETTILPDEVFVSTGALSYQKPRRLLRRGEEPPTMLLVDSQSVYEYEPELKQVARHNIADGPEAEILFFGFDNNLDSLRATYDVQLFSLLEEDEPKDAQGLLITPRAIYEEDAFFREVTLYLRAEDYLPYRIRIVTDEDSHVVFEVLDLEVNAELSAEETTITIPEGHTYVDERDRARAVGPEGMVLPLPAFGPAGDRQGDEEGGEEIAPAPVAPPPAPLSIVEELPAPQFDAPL